MDHDDDLKVLVGALIVSVLLLALASTVVAFRHGNVPTWIAVVELSMLFISVGLVALSALAFAVLCLVEKVSDSFKRLCDAVVASKHRSSLFPTLIAFVSAGLIAVAARAVDKSSPVAAVVLPLVPAVFAFIGTLLAQMGIDERSWLLKILGLVALVIPIIVLVCVGLTTDWQHGFKSLGVRDQVVLVTAGSVYAFAVLLGLALLWWEHRRPPAATGR